MKIAVDFDGTIVEHEYPAIGEEKLFAVETLKQLQKRGHQIILWTFRAGDDLQLAIDWCKVRGLEFYAVNKNYPEEVFDDTVSRKILADIYIDDRNLGGFIEWSDVWTMLQPDSIEEMEKVYLKKTRKGMFKKLFS